ncbi:MAG: dual specificity protein phosphatase family protein [Phycisphaeraceae bacterium]
MSLRIAQAAAALGLSLLFLSVYGLTMFLSSLRSDIPSYVLPLEQYAPFVPWLIIPYMSIDLFFIASPFLLNSRRALLIHVQRITFAILFAGACFLLMPLQFSFTRPHVDGPLGAVFNTFRSLDGPFNEFPSLHMTLLVLLTAVYWQRTRGTLRIALAVWFALIALSPVLVYQHHLIDILGGLLLGLACLHLFHDHPRGSTNPRVAALYLAGAVALTALIRFTPVWPHSLPLLWIPLAMLLVGIAYLRACPGIYRKHHGRLPLSTWLLFWPLLLAQHLSWRYYARQCDAHHPLTDRIWIGRLLTTRQANDAIHDGVVAVIDLTVEFSQTSPFLLQNIAYLHLPTLDLTAPTPDQLNTALKFIETHTPGGIVYIHCKAGYSRTAIVAGAWLLHSHTCTPTTVHQILQRTRPTIILRPEATSSLAAFAGQTHAEKT